MPLIDCEVELILNWSVNCVIISTNVANQVLTFTITEPNLHIPLVKYQLKIMQNITTIRIRFQKNNKLEQIPSKTRIISTKCKFKSSN